MTTLLAATTTDVHERVLVLEHKATALTASIETLKWCVLALSALVVVQIVIKLWEGWRTVTTLRNVDKTLENVNESYATIVHHGMLTGEQTTKMVEAAGTVKRHAERIDEVMHKVRVRAAIDGPDNVAVPVMEAPVVVIEKESPAAH